MQRCYRTGDIKSPILSYSGLAFLAPGTYISLNWLPLMTGSTPQGNAKE